MRLSGTFRRVISPSVKAPGGSGSEKKGLPPVAEILDTK